MANARGISSKAGCDVIRSVLRLKPKAAGPHELIDFYEQRQILPRALAAGGCESAELHVRLPDRDEVIISALWASVDAYQAWTHSPGRAEDVVELQALLATGAQPLEPAELFEVVACLPASEGEAQC